MLEIYFFGLFRQIKKIKLFDTSKFNINSCLKSNYIEIIKLDMNKARQVLVNILF